MLLSWEQNPLRADLELLKDETSVFLLCLREQLLNFPFPFRPHTQTKGCTFSVPSRSPQRANNGSTVKHTFIPKGRRCSGLLFFFFVLLFFFFQFAKHVNCRNPPVLFQTHCNVISTAGRGETSWDTNTPSKNTHTHAHSHACTHAVRGLSTAR